MMFVHLFPLIIGYLIPPDDAVWSLFITFSRINDILMSFEFTPNLLDELNSLIISFHADYLHIFSDNLTQKK